MKPAIDRADLSRPCYEDYGTTNRPRVLSLHVWLPERNAIIKIFGAWLSLVERLVRDQEVQSSNLCAPTTFLPVFKKLQLVDAIRQRAF